MPDADKPTSPPSCGNVALTWRLTRADDHCAIELLNAEDVTELAPRTGPWPRLSGAGLVVFALLGTYPYVDVMATEDGEPICVRVEGEDYLRLPRSW